MRRGYSGYKRAQLHLLRRYARPLSTRDGRIPPKPGRYTGTVIESTRVCVAAGNPSVSPSLAAYTTVIRVSGADFRVRSRHRFPSGTKLEVEIAYVGDTEVYVDTGAAAVVRDGDLVYVASDVGAALEYISERGYQLRKLRIKRWRPI